MVPLACAATTGHQASAPRGAMGAPMPKKESVRCSCQIEGPSMYGGNIVAWRRQCKNRTTNENGRCHLHQGRTAGKAFWR